MTNHTVVEHHREAHVSTQPRIVLTVMVTLLFAAFFKHHQARLFFPFTVLMFLFGMAIGGLAHAFPEMHYYLEIENIDPHLIFHVFLPVLIFDGATALKLTVFTKVFKQALVLAGPGLITNTTLVAITMRYILYDFSWPAAFLFGAILSATDPVAVVAILKELDADTAVSTLTDGEALLNDGTAIILFAIFQPAAEHGGEFWPWHEYIWRALLFTVGAYIIGKVSGMCMLYCMTRTHNEPVVETLIQLGGAYVVFWAADVPFQSSGVLALATMGIHISSNRNLVSKGLSEMVENFWELIVFIANAVIFALVGLIITVNAIPKATGKDYGMLIALYILIHLFRAVMIGAYMPFFLSGHYKMTVRRYVMLVYGALRGGVSLTLALIVAGNPNMPEEVQNTTLFLVGGIVIFSIALNGSTSKFIVQLLGLNLKPPYRKYQYRHGQKMVEAATDEAIRELRGKANAGYVNWPLLRQRTVKQLKEVAPDDPTATGATQEELFYPAMIRSMKHALIKRREEAMISAASFDEMIQLINEHIDEGVMTTIDHIVEMLERFPNVKPEEGCLDWWARTYSMLFGSYTAHAVMHVEILTNFIDILEAVKPTVFLLLSRRHSVKEHVKWIDDQLARSREILDEYHQRYSSITSGLHTLRTAQHVLQCSMRAVTELEDGRGFPRCHVGPMRLEISHIMHQLASTDLTTVPEPSHQDVFHSCIIFEQIPLSVHHRVLAVSTLVHVEPKTAIRSETDMGIVVHGRIIKSDRDDENYTYGPGDYFGLLSSIGSAAGGNYYALDEVIYYKIDGVKFRNLLGESGKDREIRRFERQLWNLCGARVAQSLLKRSYPYSTYSMMDLLSLAKAGVLSQAPAYGCQQSTCTNEDALQLFDVTSPVMRKSVFREPSEMQPLASIDMEGEDAGGDASAADHQAESDDSGLPKRPLPSSDGAVVKNPMSSIAARRRRSSENSVVSIDGVREEESGTDQEFSPRDREPSGNFMPIDGFEETYTDENSSWFLLSGEDITGKVSSMCMQLLPIGYTFQWEPGTIVFRLKDFPIAKRKIHLTGISIVDAFNTKFELMLSTVENARAHCAKALPIITPQLVSYCQIFPVIEALLNKFGLAEKFASGISMEAITFTQYVRQWTTGAHVVPLDESEVLKPLSRWLDSFINTERAWAKAIVQQPFFDPHDYTSVSSVVSKEAMLAWWKDKGFIFDLYEPESDADLERNRMPSFSA